MPRRRLILAAVAVAVVSLAAGGWWYKARADRYEAMLADRTEYANERRHAIGMSELWDAWEQNGRGWDGSEMLERSKWHTQRAERLKGEYELKYGRTAPDLTGLNTARSNAAEIFTVKAKELAREFAKKAAELAQPLILTGIKAGMTERAAAAEASRAVAPKVAASFDETLKALDEEYRAIK